jgi:hypothetical protein
MYWRTCAAAILATASLLSLSAQSQTLYVAPGSGGVAGNLYTVDPGSGAATIVGPLLVGAAPIALTGMAFDPTTNTLYGITSVQSPNIPRHLVRINRSTGAAIDVGALGIGGADLAFAANGTLYMSSGQATNIYTVNTATGVATLLGATGVSNVGSALAINAAGTAFFAGNGASGALSTINLATGAATPGPLLTGAPIPGGAGGSINSMKFDAGGNLFAVNNRNAVVPDFLVRIDTTTGAVTTVGPLPLAIDALAFGPAVEPFSVPTLGQWALVALALMLAATGAVALRRRQA